MLDELRIRGLGVIDDALLPLGPGLTVVTGETGAGKTMVVTGLLLLFGGRADSARVRTGVEQASVDGRLVIAPDSPGAARARDTGGELDDGELTLRRVVSANGRSRAYVGGAPAPVAVLAELAESLVAIHGQADQHRLARPAAQRDALDRYAGIERSGYTAAFTRWRTAAAALDERVARSAELRRESDLLAYGLAEIETAAPQPGEADELAALAGRLGHVEALTDAARTAHDALLGDADDPTGEAVDVSGLLAGAGRALAVQRGDDPQLAALADRLTELAALAADLGQEFGTYAAGLDADPARLEQVETRRAELAALVRKYCDDPEPSLDGVHRWADAARARLSTIDVSDEAIAALRAETEAAAHETAQAAAALSAARSAAGTRLAAAVTTELHELAMADAQLHVRVERRPPGTGATLAVDGGDAGATADGIDEVTFELQARPAGPALPLGRGASGGELSRVMLAVEVCLNTSGASPPVPTMVFDEIDAGVGGRAAVEVGRRLARLAAQCQVLVVTHLAQVAAFADRHVVVDKPTGRGADDGVTASDVRLANDDARIGELARMLAGSDSPVARRHAEELLADARGRSIDKAPPGNGRARSPDPKPAVRKSGRAAGTPSRR